MKRFALVIVVVTLAAGGTAAQDLERLFKAAVNTETVDRNCKGAIEQYKKVAAGSNRALAARALLRMAGCYEKLGDDEAQRTYQRLVRDFSDQKDSVAIARGRLAAHSAPLTTTAVRGDRAVWTGPDVDLFGTVSPDGRFLTYVDWGGARNVMVRDLLTQASWTLTENTAEKRTGTADFSVISKDGTQVAYWWSTQPQGEFRVASLRTPGAPQTRVVRTGGYVRPFDWAPDSRSIAALVNDNQIAIVSLQDGSVRQLKSVDWNGVGKVVFSPDGKHIAYDLTSADGIGQRDIRVMTVDGSSEVVVVADAFRNHVMGWSSAGQLVYSSDRTGTRSLWTVQVANGLPQGVPRLARENVRSTMSLGLTSVGTLYVWQPASPSYVSVQPFDSEHGRILPGKGGTFQQFIESRGWPRWSPDGKRLLFISCGLTGGGPCALYVRDGQNTPREVPHAMWYIFPPEFSPDGQKIIARGSDRKDRSGIFVIDVATGATSMLIAHERDGLSYPRNPIWSTDGRAVFYVATDREDFVVLRREIEGKESSEVFRTAGGPVQWMAVSPDERHVVIIRRSNGTQPATLIVTPLAEPAPRAIFTGPSLEVEQWDNSGQSMIVHKHIGDRFEVWRVPLTGSPVKLQLEGTSTTGMYQLSPDRKYVAFKDQAGEAGDQVWALENFLPPFAKP